MRVLDMFCGAGGCSVGYKRAMPDAYIVGVDIVAQPNYPYDFVQGDALLYLSNHWHEFDFIHASPPCQAHSKMNHMHKNTYVDFILVTREMLKAIDKPYVIENVEGAPLNNYLKLRGDMFHGLKVVRERWFETSFYCEQPAIPTIKHGMPSAGRGAAPDGFVSVVGTGGLGGGLSSEYANYAMGINWMHRAELSQAIPPQYTHYIGNQYKGDNTSLPLLKVPIQKSMFDITT